MHFEEDVPAHEVDVDETGECHEDTAGELECSLGNVSHGALLVEGSSTGPNVFVIRVASADEALDALCLLAEGDGARTLGPRPDLGGLDLDPEALRRDDLVDGAVSPDDVVAFGERSSHEVVLHSREVRSVEVCDDGDRIAPPPDHLGAELDRDEHERHDDAKREDKLPHLFLLGTMGVNALW